MEPKIVAGEGIEIVRQPDGSLLISAVQMANAMVMPSMLMMASGSFGGDWSSVRGGRMGVARAFSEQEKTQIISNRNLSPSKVAKPYTELFL